MSNALVAPMPFGLVIGSVGALLIVGALRRWSWLVDPPRELWYFYSQSLLKVLIGSEGCRIITANIGAALFLAGTFIVVQAVLA